MAVWSILLWHSHTSSRYLSQIPRDDIAESEPRRGLKIIRYVFQITLGSQLLRTSSASRFGKGGPKRRLYATFIHDPAFVSLLDWYPADNIMWSSERPHGRASFPCSQEYVAQHLSKVSETDRQKTVHDAAAKFYGLG